MKPQIKISLLPLYKSNLSDLAYLFNDKKNDQKVLELTWLDEALFNLSKKYDIVQIDIEGGEISLLSDFYFTLLFNLLKSYCKRIYVYTNFIEFNKGLINNFEIINVNFNYSIKGIVKQTIFDNIKAAISSGKVINMKTLDISCQENKDMIINQLNDLKIKSWEIIPYHKSKGSIIEFKDYKLYENTVKEFLKLYPKMQFSFQNKLQLDKILKLDNYNIKKIYLTPDNTYALSNFDENNTFFLDEYTDFDLFSKKVAEMEIFRNNFCEKCTSKIQCMSNKFFNYKYKGTSCSGFKNLINEYNRQGK